jgi:hypothetical protein
MTTLNLKQVLLKLLDYAKKDTESNVFDLYIKYDKIFKATYSLINEQPSSITIQYLIDRFKFKLFELTKFTKACGVLSQYEATCDTSIIIKFSKIPKQYFVSDVGFIDETDTRPFNEIVRPALRNIIVVPQDVIINIPDAQPLPLLPLSPQSTPSPGIARRPLFFNSSSCDVKPLPDKKDEIVKRFNAEIDKVSVSTNSGKFKDIRIQILKNNLEKIMTCEYIKCVDDIKCYNDMKGASVDIIDEIFKRKV